MAVHDQGPASDMREQGQGAYDSLLSSTQDYAGRVATKGQAVVDGILPPESRNALLEKSQAFIHANPKLSVGRSTYIAALLTRLTRSSSCRHSWPSTCSSRGSRWVYSSSSRSSPLSAPLSLASCSACSEQSSSSSLRWVRLSASCFRPSSSPRPVLASSSRGDWSATTS